MPCSTPGGPHAKPAGKNASGPSAPPGSTFATKLSNPVRKRLPLAPSHSTSVYGAANAGSANGATATAGGGPPQPGAGGGASAAADAPSVIHKRPSCESKPSPVSGPASTGGTGKPLSGTPAGV